MMWSRGPLHEQFFHLNSNSMENWFGVTPLHDNILLQNCAHAMTADVHCTKFHSNHFTISWMRAEWNFHRILITIEKSFVKGAPDCLPCKHMMLLLSTLVDSYMSLLIVLDWFDKNKKLFIYHFNLITIRQKYVCICMWIGITGGTRGCHLQFHQWWHTWFI